MVELEWYNAYMSFRKLYHLSQCFYGNKDEINQGVDVIEAHRSTDGSAKLLQGVLTHKKPTILATFETGRYFLREEEKVCLSCQIGCAMGYSFCVTGQPYEYTQGIKTTLLRNLSTEEIVQQAQNALREVPPKNSQSRIVFAFMGMGEPFANLENVVGSIDKLAELYPNSSVTLSTIGFDLSAIESLADEVSKGRFLIPVDLHLSLHGSTDKRRKTIIPRGAALEPTIKTAKYYADKVGREVLMNYVLVRGRNDTIEDARKLGLLFRGKPGLVLKISDLNSSVNDGVHKIQTDAFEQTIRGFGVPTYRFNSLGTDIEAGCGEFAKGNRPLETILVQVVDTEQRMLIMRRRPYPDTDYGGDWSIVSGHRENGDPSDEALREVFEETGISLKPKKLVPMGVYLYKNPDNQKCAVVHAFRAVVSNNTKIKLNLNEHTAYRWIEQQGLSLYNLARPLLEEMAAFRIISG